MLVPTWANGNQRRRSDSDVQLFAAFLATCFNQPELFKPLLCTTLRRTRMAKFGCSTLIRFLVFGVLVFAATSWAQTRSPIAEQIAKAYGLDSYDQVEAIRYTFNIR